MANKKQVEKKAGGMVSARKRASEQDFGGRSYLNIPDGCTFFEVKKAGSYRIDIIPYLTGKGNPYQPEEGEPYFERTFWVHTNVGPDEKKVICPLKNFKKPCPLCEDYQRLKRDKDANEDLVKSLRPSERQLWNVIDVTESKPKIQVFDISSFCFGKLLLEMVDKADRIKGSDEGEYDRFPDLQKGYTLKLNVKEEKLPRGSYCKVTGIEFKKRDEEYDNSLMKKAYNLDEMLREVSYEKLAEMYGKGAAGDDDADDDDEPIKKKKKTDDDEDEPIKKGKKKEEEEDDDDDDDDDTAPTADEAGIKVGSMVEHDDHGTCKVIHVSSDGTSLRIKDSDDAIHKAIAIAEVTLAEEDDEDEDEEEEKPKKKPGKKPVKKKEEEEDDDDSDDDDDDDSSDDDDDDEEETPAKKPDKKKPGKKADKEDDDDDDWGDDDEDDDSSDDDSSDDDEDEEEEKPKKKPGKNKK